jgi:hypothetical protein
MLSRLVTQEIADDFRDLNAVRLQREVAGVEEVNRCPWDVPLECLSAEREEERIVLAPHRQKWRLMCPEISLKRRIQRDIAFIVAQKAELNFICSGTSQVVVVKVPTVRRHKRGIGHAVRVLPGRHFGREKCAKRFPVRLRRVFPVRSDRDPPIAEALFVSIPVLRDDRCDPLWMTDGHSKAGRPTVIKDVESEAIEAHDLRKALDYASDVLKCVKELLSRWHLRLAETGKVRRDHVELFGDDGKQFAKHMACARKTVQEKQLRRPDIPRFAIENPGATNFDYFVSDRTHQTLLLFALRLPIAFIVPKKLGISTLREFVEKARGAAKPLTYGLGSSAHIIGEVLMKNTGIKLLQVPYRGEAPALTAFLAGEVDSAFVSVGGAMAHEEKAKTLAIANPARMKRYPDIPTFDESGFPVLGLTGFSGFFAPAAISRPVAERLTKELREIVSLPDVNSKLLDFGFEDMNDVTDFPAFIDGEVKRSASVIREFNISI